jgi:HlyD family secretion protein
LNEEDAMKKVGPLLVVLAVLAAFWIYHKRHPDFSYAGTLEADEVELQPGVASPIAALNVEEGDVVKRDQLLVVLSCPDIRVAAGQALSDFNRNLSLYQAGSLAAAGFDRSRYASRDAQVKLAWCNVTAPIDGTVLVIYRRPGEWARPGQPILALADLRNLYSFIYVPQGLLARLRLGQSIDCKLPELPGKIFKGRIVYIRPQAEFTPKNVQTREERARLVYGVKLRFENPEGILKPGMSIEAQMPDLED